MTKRNRSVKKGLGRLGKLTIAASTAFVSGVGASTADVNATTNKNVITPEILGIQVEESVNVPVHFTDIGDYWAKPSIHWAVQMGIIKEGGKFRPADNVTVEEFTNMLGNYIGRDLVTTGENSKEPITKLQIATLIVAELGIQLTDTELMNFVYETNLNLEGLGKGDIAQAHGPNMPLQRDQAILLIKRLDANGYKNMLKESGINEEKGITLKNLSLTFTDTTGHWVTQGSNTLQWAIREGITTGFPDGTFRPNDNVTEAQFLAMLIRKFEEVRQEREGELWHTPYYEFSTRMNYPTGTNPNGVITRTHVAEILSGARGVNYKGDHAVQYLLGHGLAKGKDPDDVSIRSYEGGSLLNRAEAIQFIKNFVDAGVTELANRPDQLSDPNLLPKLPDQKPVTSDDENKKLKSITQTVGELHRLADEYGFERDDKRNLEGGYFFRDRNRSVQADITDSGGLSIRVNHNNDKAVDLGIHLAKTNGITASESQIREAMEKASEKSQSREYIRMDNGVVYAVTSKGSMVTISVAD